MDNDLVAFILIVLGLINIFIIVDNRKNDYYSYLDTLNNKGVAEYCYTDGLMYCRLEDNKFIQVYEFKLVRKK